MQKWLKMFHSWESWTFFLQKRVTFPSLRDPIFVPTSYIKNIHPLSSSTNTFFQRPTKKELHIFKGKICAWTSEVLKWMSCNNVKRICSSLPIFWRQIFCPSFQKRNEGGRLLRRKKFAKNKKILGKMTLDILTAFYSLWHLSLPYNIRSQVNQDGASGLFIML